ncbi:hypothetical protein [Chryseobacterium vrystaatense]|uniref:Uncharacterized protein n=1 Tax=Chryseobacterium vrystaatense TaxID=307480 RepID=A0ABR4UP07_9FLAO|nr:hypothetical protein [Chryseobacterium vrystaatense]KFF26798.1 hypothetical protein IW16_05790 [Chryseobacterium vrystaatense]
MSIPLNTIYSYFETGDFPTQDQFQASWSSFWHKDESIPTSKITGLENLLQNKADKSVYELHLSDPEAHTAFLAKKNASNLSESDRQSWKAALNVGELPDNVATVDSDPLVGNVYTKSQSQDLFMMIDEYVNNDGKITADKLEALALTRIFKVNEHTLQDFMNNSDAYEYEESDIIAVPSADSEPRYTLYFYIGGDKKDIKSYLNTGVSTISMSMVEGLADALKQKLERPTRDGNYYLKQDQGFTLWSPLPEPTLADVVNKDAYSPQPITFINGEERPNGMLGMNPATYSLFFGNMNPNHTGVYNIALGYNNMPSLTTGSSNTIVGHFAGKAVTTGGANVVMGLDAATGLTTGNDNTLIGVSSGYGLAGGKGNAMLGKWSGCFITGDNNTFLGYQAGQYWGKGGSGKWSSNIVIGGGTTGHPMGVWGENSIIIGSNLELNGQQNNKFIINNFLAKDNNYYKTHFIEGNFADRWLRFDTSLQVLRMPAADASYTKNIVARPDGTFGTEDRVDYIPLTGTKTGKPVSGNIEFSKDFLAKLYCGSSELYINNGLISMHANQSNISVSDFGADITDGVNAINLKSDTSHISVKSNVDGAGLLGADYYGKNYEPNSFVQKQWVEERIGGIGDVHPYKVYIALMQFSDDGNFEPQFNVLENTIGDFEWKRQDIGRYIGFNKDLFSGNLWINSNINYYDRGMIVDCRSIRNSKDSVDLNIFRVSEYNPIDLTGEIGIIEIRLYPVTN